MKLAELDKLCCLCYVQTLVLEAVSQKIHKLLVSWKMVLASDLNLGTVSLCSYININPLKPELNLNYI
jgi:hypothetical protein